MKIAFSNLPSSRKEANALKITFFYTGKPCIHGHIAKRRTANNACAECTRLYMKAYWRAKNPLENSSSWNNKQKVVLDYLDQIAALSLKITHTLKAPSND
jgi:hypothetical protein